MRLQDAKAIITAMASASPLLPFSQREALAAALESFAIVEALAKADEPLAHEGDAGDNVHCAVCGAWNEYTGDHPIQHEATCAWALARILAGS